MLFDSNQPYRVSGYHLPLSDSSNTAPQCPDSLSEHMKNAAHLQLCQHICCHLLACPICTVLPGREGGGGAFP